MKLLSILRHAKAERPAGYEADIARPLTKRGFKDAAATGELLARSEPAVDWMISSPALRTRQTAEALRENLPDPPKVIWHEAVYEANLAALLEALRMAPASTQHLLLVGHNPGMEELTAALCTGSPDRLHLHMATAALASVRLEIHSWGQVRPGCGTLLSLVRPSLFR